MLDTWALINKMGKQFKLGHYPIKKTIADQTQKKQLRIKHTRATNYLPYWSVLYLTGAKTRSCSDEDQTQKKATAGQTQKKTIAYQTKKKQLRIKHKKCRSNFAKMSNIGWNTKKSIADQYYEEFDYYIVIFLHSSGLSGATKYYLPTNQALMRCTRTFNNKCIESSF